MTDVGTAMNIFETDKRQAEGGYFVSTQKGHDHGCDGIQIKVNQCLIKSGRSKANDGHNVMTNQRSPLRNVVLLQLQVPCARAQFFGSPLGCQRPRDGDFSARSHSRLSDPPTSVSVSPTAVHRSHMQGPVNGVRSNVPLWSFRPRIIPGLTSCSLFGRHAYLQPMPVVKTERCRKRARNIGYFSIGD